MRELLLCPWCEEPQVDHVLNGEQVHWEAWHKVWPGVETRRARPSDMGLRLPSAFRVAKLQRHRVG